MLSFSLLPLLIKSLTVPGVRLLHAYRPLDARVPHAGASNDVTIGSRKCTRASGFVAQLAEHRAFNSMARGSSPLELTC